MSKDQAHDAAIAMAAGRTTYSLARELLGVRAELARLRTEADDASLLPGAYVRACEELSELKAALVEEGEPVPVGPALSLVRRLKEERALLRDTLANMEAEEGQEITALRQELEVAIELAGKVEPLEKDNRDLRREVAAWRGA